ncbi:BlaI/MecI/CopY family transcriptional regulator [Frisingicoccus caecimuris]|jgi:BlaI family penicillinase repressor|uniref:BlaI family penicillinase repressor n=1 Tax=Frisingicoccus caecimuris TaxID=1796636 RepID=A0A4R2LI49_9FIRM|nr:BlaI/MecI/CopY family transcriptional regulator [Frisingicoccus caecimuris]MCR1919068.1 BlaI/MecI/CopY family transcriptional regulator [Frisingicoccus caecimuris]TCO84846.1 BlaI family penicillinase repressor [Frisingicoccus caecimuris]
MNCLPQISEAEYEVMKVVWKESPVNTNVVTEILTKTTNWSPKTIQTLLKRLVNKGALTYEKQGRVFVYMPLIQESAYVRQKSRSFLKRYFDGDMSRMLSACLDEETLTKNEIDTLREILAKHEK